MNMVSLCNKKSTLGIISPVTSSVNAGVWRRREGVWQVLKRPSLLAEPSLSLMTIMCSHHPLGKPLPEHSSTSTTNLHQQPGYLQALASLAGTRDKTHWPGRLLANTPLPSSYRGDTDWGMNYWPADNKPLDFVILRS